MELQTFNDGGVDDEQYVQGANTAAGYGNSSSWVAQVVNAYASCSSFVRSKRGYTLILLLLTTICLFADQNIMAPNLSQIAEEFEISDEERDARLGGDVSVAFFIVGGPVGIAAGWYTDRYPQHYVRYSGIDRIYRFISNVLRDVARYAFDGKGRDGHQHRRCQSRFVFVTI